MEENYTIGEKIVHFLGAVLFLVGLFFIYGFFNLIIMIFRGETTPEEPKWKALLLNIVILIIVFWLSFKLLDYREYIPIDRLY